jgi:hypothetical protein
MSSGKVNEELLNNIELEVKSENNSNSEALSADDLPKKEIISNNNNNSDPYTEVQLVSNNSNNDKNENNEKIKAKEEENEKDKSPASTNLKDAFGDLTSIIKDKIKAKVKENNKPKKNRVLSVSGMSCIANANAEKNNKINESMQSSLVNTVANSNTANIDSYSKNTKNKKIRANISAPKNNKDEITKKNKKKAELFINKKKNENNDSMKNNGNLTSRKNDAKKSNFNEVLKRFEEEKKAKEKKLDDKRKELIDKEISLCTGKPQITKMKKGNTSDKYSKDFLVRQKEINDHLNLKKQRLIEEENKKKEKEYQKIIDDSILHKKMKKLNKNGSDDQWVERLYKEDTKKRKIEKEYMEQAAMPSFQPYVFKKKKKCNKSVERIGNVLEKYKENQNPQLLIDYYSKNNRKDNCDNLFRKKLFNKNAHKNKIRSKSIDENNNNEDNE